MPNKVLTINEVPALLKLAKKTAYSMTLAGEIPAWSDAQPRGGNGGRDGDA